jgi:hypothetical protein
LEEIGGPTAADSGGEGVASGSRSRQQIGRREKEEREREREREEEEVARQLKLRPVVPTRLA